MLIPMLRHMYWQSNQMDMGWKFINSLLHLRNCIIWPRNRNQSSLSCVVESSDFNHLREVSASLFYGHVPMGLLLIFSVACQFGVQKKKIYRRLFQHFDSPTISIDIYDMSIMCVARHLNRKPIPEIGFETNFFSGDPLIRKWSDRLSLKMGFRQIRCNR